MTRIPGASFKSDAQGIGAEFLITIGGIVTTLATIGANALISRWLDFNLLSLSVWFVIPVGAIIGGMGAASGYYFTAIITHTMPSRRFLLEMVAIGVSAWFLGQWIEYATLTLDDGTSVSSLVSFWDYFKFHAEHEQLTIRTRYGGNVGSTGELGALGYAREVLQLLGFMVGGLVVWNALSEKEMCSGCRKYAKVDRLLTAASAEQFQAVLNDSRIELPGLVEAAKAAIGKQRFIGLDLTLAQCPRCMREWARPAVVIARGKNPERVRLGAYDTAPDLSGNLRAAAAAVKTAKPTSGTEGQRVARRPG